MDTLLDSVKFTEVYTLNRKRGIRPYGKQQRITVSLEKVKTQLATSVGHNSAEELLTRSKATVPI